MANPVRSIVCSIALVILFGDISTLRAQRPSGVFRTAPGAVLEDCFFECSERAVSGVFRLDSSGVLATLSAEVVDPKRRLPSAGSSDVRVWSYDSFLPDGRSVEFVGEYLPGYAFQWRFTQAPSGEVFWSGITAWTGGRLDMMTMADVHLVPVPFLAGDYNASGAVEQADLDLVLQNWGELSPPVPFDWVQDVPKGLVGQAALDGVLMHWGDVLPQSTNAGQVPEPAAWWVLLALLPLFLRLIRAARP
jgi:hypothetical protein